MICLRASTLSALIASEPGVAAPFLFNLARILAVRLAGMPFPSRVELVS